MRESQPYKNGFVSILCVLLLSIDQSLPKLISSHVIESVLDGRLKMSLYPSDLLAN